MAGDFSYMEYKEEEPSVSGAPSRVGLDHGELEELFGSFSTTRDTTGTVEFGRLPFMLRCLGCSDVETNSIFGKVKGTCVQARPEGLMGSLLVLFVCTCTRYYTGVLNS